MENSTCCTFYEFIKLQNVKLGPLLEKCSLDVLCHVLSFLTLVEISRTCVRLNRFWQHLCDEDPSNALWAHFSKPNQSLQGDCSKFIRRELRKELDSGVNWRFFLHLFNLPTLYNFHWAQHCTTAGVWLMPKEESLGKQFINKNKVVHIAGSNGNISLCGNFGFSSANTVLAPCIGYIEFRIDKKSDRWNLGVGLAEESFFHSPKRFVGLSNRSWSYSSDGKIRFQLTNQQAKQLAPNFEEYTTGDCVGMFVDLNANSISFLKNGQLVHALTTVTSSKTLYPTVTLHAVGDSVSLCQEKISLSPFRMLELAYQADTSRKQRRLQQKLEERVARLKRVKEEYVAKKKQKDK